MNYQFYIYLLESNDRLLYTGMTNNIQRRFNEHQKGLNPRSFTFKRRPVELLFHEQFNDVFQAYHFEARIKKW
ncbi:GIY-YIG nuclease family protein [Nonlabens sp. Asnod2-A12]|uniref:GIY-YIG nuclease family protein n=1 Tax=Nonlabens sp. Asnod2-A12 TaxID=3160578 RepID=UPI0038697736